MPTNPFKSRSSSREKPVDPQIENTPILIPIPPTLPSNNPKPNAPPQEKETLQTTLITSEETFDVYNEQTFPPTEGILKNETNCGLAVPSLPKQGTRGRPVYRGRSGGTAKP